MDIGALDPAAYDGRIEHLDCYGLDRSTWPATRG
jgi:hypothetical protein